MALQDATLDAIIPTSNREGPFDACMVAASLCLSLAFRLFAWKIGFSHDRSRAFFRRFHAAKGRSTAYVTETELRSRCLGKNPLNVGPLLEINGQKKFIQGCVIHVLTAVVGLRNLS